MIQFARQLRFLFAAPLLVVVLFVSNFLTVSAQEQDRCSTIVSSTVPVTRYYDPFAGSSLESAEELGNQIITNFETLLSGSDARVVLHRLIFDRRIQIAERAGVTIVGPLILVRGRYYKLSQILQELEKQLAKNSRLGRKSLSPRDVALNYFGFFSNVDSKNPDVDDFEGYIMPRTPIGDEPIRTNFIRPENESEEPLDDDHNRDE